MLKAPPYPTLFPYTTLFRSARHLRAAEPARLGGRLLRARSRRPAAGRERRDGRDRRQDRNSTRLNSSHLVISYVVSCLKKKYLISVTDDYTPVSVCHSTHSA